MEDAVLTEEYRRNLSLIRRLSHAEENEDAVIRVFRALGKDAAVIYVDGLADGNAIQRFLMQPLLSAGPPKEETPLDTYLAQSVLPLCALTQGGILPLSRSTLWIDIPFCLLITGIMLAPALIKRRFYRWQGAVSLLLYLLYTILLFAF